MLDADTRKRSYTIAAVCAATGEVLGEKTVAVGAGGFGSLVVWARGLHGERVWALEDCRHVSGSFERFLPARAERIVRVRTKLLAAAPKGGRQRGKSEAIDSISVARAALAEGLDSLPAARLDERQDAGLVGELAFHRSSCFPVVVAAVVGWSPDTAFGASTGLSAERA